MKITSIEFLPNELWLIIFNYLSSIDLFRAWNNLNHRIDELLFSIKNSSIILDTSQINYNAIHFSDMQQLIQKNSSWSKSLYLSIDTIHLCDTIASDIFRHLNLFPSLRRLFLSEGAIYKFDIIELLLPICKTLRHIHITFRRLTDKSSYFQTLNKFHEHQLSFYSMTFNVIHADLTYDHYTDDYQWENINWLNTVRTSVYIKNLNDLFILVNYEKLPCLEYLSVTFIKQNQKQLEENFQEIKFVNITSHIRSLKLSYMSLDDLLMFLSSIKMPLLEKLVLIEIYDNTLRYLSDFQHFIQSKENFPRLCLSSVEFLFRFPGELVSEWKTNRNYDELFDKNNIDYCLEEEHLKYFHYWRAKTQAPEKKYSLLIFTRSVFSFHRYVHNQLFEMKIKQKSSIHWSCDSMRKSDDLLIALEKFRLTKNLVIDNWFGTDMENNLMKSINFPSESNQLKLNNLRSLTFFKVGARKQFLLRTQQNALLHLILSSAPQLQELTANWNDIMEINATFDSNTYSTLILSKLRYLCLLHYNRQARLNLSKLIDISVLSQSFPGLVSFSTAGRDIYPDENFERLIRLIVTHFKQLIELTLNKDSSELYYIRDDPKILNKQKEQIINELKTIPKLCDIEQTQISWNHGFQLQIWL